MELILFGVAVWFWLLVGILFITMVISEANENGWFSFIIFIIVCGLIGFFGSIDLHIIWQMAWKIAIIAILYLVIGILFVAFRVLDNLPIQFRNHVYRWWFNWPGSLFWWLMSDFIIAIGDSLYAILRQIYKAGVKSTPAN